MDKGAKAVIAFFGGIGVVFGIIAFVVQSSLAKWILGILAALSIGLFIYMIIDAMTIDKRRKKDVSDIVKNTMNKPDFAKEMMKMQQRRDILYKGQRAEDPDYGYSASNPIMTSTIESNKKYLARLRTIDGKSFSWVRNGSLCMTNLHGVKEVMVDIYQLYLDGKEYKKIYICPYGHSSSFVPQGMTLADE